METQQQEQSAKYAEETDNSNSKSEILMKNITIPNSQFQAKWKNGEGYSIGYENIRITKNFETLEEALNKIGYGVDKDEEGDEILVKTGETDFETIAYIIKAMLIIYDENKEKLTEKNK